jgi:hypothetical protein
LQTFNKELLFKLSPPKPKNSDKLKMKTE